MVERVAKSRVSNRSDSKKSDSGTQKVGYFVGYHALFTPDLEMSGSGSPKKSGLGTQKVG